VPLVSYYSLCMRIIHINTWSWPRCCSACFVFSVLSWKLMPSYLC